MIEELLPIIKAHDERRFPHVYSTYLKALELAKKYHVDEEKCGVAALLHDYAKHYPLEQLIQVIEEHLDPKLLQYDTVIYHGPVGGYLIQAECGIHDQEIIDAVTDHVTGRPDMSPIAKIVYIADYIEDLRTHPSVDCCRYLATLSLDLGVLGCAEATMNYLKTSKIKGTIHPLTQATYETFLQKVGKTTYDTIRNRCKEYR